MNNNHISHNRSKALDHLVDKCNAKIMTLRGTCTQTSINDLKARYTDKTEETQLITLRQEECFVNSSTFSDVLCV